MKIDFNYLETLSDGDPVFIKDFIQTFENTAESLTKKLQEEFGNKDFSNLSKTAHQLKPSAKMLGLDAGDTLENLQNEPENATQELIDKVKNECFQGLEETKEWARKKGVDI